MCRPRIVALAVALPVLLLPATGSATSLAHDRVYFMASDSDYLYWSVDPDDPELGPSTAVRNCGTLDVWGIPDRSKPCFSGGVTGTYYHSMFFLPASLLEENITWSVAEPLRYHIEASVNTGGLPFDMRLVLQKGSELVEAPLATEVQPGIWEGELAVGSPLHRTQVNLLMVRVETQSSVATIELGTGGSSYIELPRPFTSSGVPDLTGADTYRPQPTSYSTDTRSFDFNDEAWAARSFTGTTGPPRTFDFELEQRAEILLVWVEMFDSAFFQDVRRGRDPDPQKIRQGAGLRVLRDGVEIEHTGSGVGGLGSDALAVPGLSPGPLTVEVDSANENEDESIPFTVHVLEIRGERTLHLMRWKFMEIDSLRLPVAAVCPGIPEAVPATDEVRSIALDLDWDTESVGLAAWTIRFGLPGVGEFPCSEAGTGDRLRITVPGEPVWYVGATPAYDATFVSAYDTTFEMQATYTYSPPPAAP